MTGLVFAEDARRVLAGVHRGLKRIETEFSHLPSYREGERLYYRCSHGWGMCAVSVAMVTREMHRVLHLQNSGHYSGCTKEGAQLVLDAIGQKYKIDIRARKDGAWYVDLTPRLRIV